MADSLGNDRPAGYSRRVQRARGGMRRSTGGRPAQAAFDVVAVGGGIAGLSTALSAAEEGARVLVLEKAPRSERGGNTRFADAQMRFPHEADQYGARTYTPAEFRDDLMRLSRGRANPELIDVLVRDAA